MISQMCKRKWRTFGTRSGVIARGMMHLVGGPTSKMALSQSAFTPWHVHRRRFKLLWQPLQVLTQVQQMRPRPSCRRRIGPGHRNRISVLQEFWLVVEKFQALYAQQSQKEAEEAIFGFVDGFFFWILCGIFHCWYPQAMAILAGGGGVPAPTPATPAGYVAPAAKAAPLAAWVEVGWWMVDDVGWWGRAGAIILIDILCFPIVS